MKKQILLLCFLLAAVAGFSQMSKADAAGYLVRNPPEKVDGIDIWEGEKNTNWEKADIVSFKSMESGFSLIVKVNGVDREKFYPYASIKYITIGGTNRMNVVLRY